MIKNSIVYNKIIAVLTLLVLTMSTIGVVGCTAAKKPLYPISPTPPSQTVKNTKPDYGPLKSQLTAYMTEKGGDYSFLLYDLNSGGVLDIGANKPIAGASTTKIPTALYLYHLAAQGKIDLNNKITYIQSQDSQGGAGALEYYAVDGWKYRYRTLGNILITLSDNIARNMLERQLGVDNIANYMSSLGGKTVFPGGQNITTSRDMVTYLKATLDFQKNYPDLGNLFINDMSNTIWDNDGLPGQLPDNVVVAHKEGDVRGIANDAGIVYLKGRPYILSVLTKNAGATVDEGFNIVAEISRMVYEFQSKLPTVTGK